MNVKLEKTKLSEEQQNSQDLQSEEIKKKRTKKKKPPKGGRWTVAALFIFTVLIGAVFYLKTELPLVWEKVSSPLIISNLDDGEKFDPLPIISQIDNLTRDLRGDYGFYVYRFADDRSYGLKQNQVFQAASLMKLPVMLTLYQEVEKGNLNLETEYQLNEKDKVSGAGILQDKPIGSIYTYRQLVNLMGQYSDNTAFAVIRKILGDKEIEATIDNLGMRQTSLRDFTTTPADMGLFFQKLYQGSLLTNQHRDEILSFLTNTAFENWLPVGMPNDVQIAHKIGRDIGVVADAGLVLAKKPLVVVLMSDGVKQSQAEEVLPKISSLVSTFEKLQ